MKKGKTKIVPLAVKERLRKSFECVCKSYQYALERMWDLHSSDGYWIGDEVGGVYDNNGYVTLSLEEIIYCVENDIDVTEYEEWSSYNIEAHDLGFDYINLKSWHNGCPRTSKETLEKLRNMKENLSDAIEQEKRNGENPY